MCFAVRRNVFLAPSAMPRYMKAIYKNLLMKINKNTSCRQENFKEDFTEERRAFENLYEVFAKTFL